MVEGTSNKEERRVRKVNISWRRKTLRRKIKEITIIYPLLERVENKQVFIEVKVKIDLHKSTSSVDN